MNRTIYVSGGRKDYVKALLSDAEGENLTTATIRLGLSTTSTTPPTEWHPAEVTPEGAGVRLALLVDETIAPPGKWYLWADVVDFPTTQPVQCGGGHVRTV